MGLQVHPCKNAHAMMEHVTMEPGIRMSEAHVREADLLVELKAYKEAERADRGRRITMHIRPEDNDFGADN